MPAQRPLVHATKITAIDEILRGNKQAARKRMRAHRARARLTPPNVEDVAKSPLARMAWRMASLRHQQLLNDLYPGGAHGEV